MLQNLHIVNLALIDELDIDFYDGLNVLTGETGAGKSIIIGSIGIGLGGRYDSSLLRDPDKDSMVELLFSVDERVVKSLEEDEIDITDGEILISRRLSKDRSVSRINGSTVTVTKLKKVAEKLISLHAQHEQRTLLKSAKHLELVDSFDPEIEECKRKYTGLYNDYRDVIRELDELTLDESERASKLDYIRYEINDIESAELKTGEDAELEDIYRKASNSQEIAEITSEAKRYMDYDMDMSAGNQISSALGVLSGLTKYDDSAQEMVDMLSDIEGLVTDFNRQLSEYISEVEYEPSILEQTETRLNRINALKARYGSTIQDILSRLEELKQQEELLSSYDETKEKLRRKREELEKKLGASADRLTAARKKAAEVLTSTIADAMRDLNFNDVRFGMNFEKTDDFTANGVDKAEFIISTNVGEDMKPLVDIASGGELSRIMLAIKSVMSEAEDTPTLIFDEIDVGISGITADKVGDMMKRIGESRQVISITHLPQIAASADTQFVIEKTVQDDRTFTNIRSLDEEGRALEIARLLGGASITDSVLTTAREMINRQ